MNTFRSRSVLACPLGLFLIVFSLVAQPLGALAAMEDSFDVLKIGTHTYRNVTVTTKAKNYIFILHSGGMTNVKVDELSPELRQTLGYADPEANKPQAHSAAGTWAKKTLAKLEVPQVKGVEQHLLSTWRSRVDLENFSFSSLDRNLVLGVAGGLMALYFGFCYCCMLICEKLGYRPGVYVWLPVLQIFALLQAAGMSPWWFFAFLVPGFNVVAQVVWCFRIVRARAKSPGLGFLLLLPGINFIALAYLAFSENAPARKAAPRVEIMTLETA